MRFSEALALDRILPGSVLVWPPLVGVKLVVVAAFAGLFIHDPSGSDLQVQGSLP